MPRSLIGLLLAAIGAAAPAQQLSFAPRADGAQVPMMVYPAASPSSTGCPPLALLSPGAGGSEQGLRYLAQGLGADGWRAIVIGHRESGMDALKRDVRSARGLRAGLATLVDDPAAYRARFMDIDAARQWASVPCKAPFTALLGHSMGAHTVQFEAGARNTAGLHPAGGFDAYVALSPAGPEAWLPADADAAITAPVLMITGTRDAGLGGDERWREQAFAALPPGQCDRLAVIDGATHMQLGGGSFDARTQQAVVALVTTWLDGLRAGTCKPAPALERVRIQDK